MEQVPTTAGGWFAHAIGTAIFSGLGVLALALVGAWLWDAGYIILAGLLLVAAGGGAVCTAWVVVGSLIAGTATATGLMREDDE